LDINGIEQDRRVFDVIRREFALSMNSEKLECEMGVGFRKEEAAKVCRRNDKRGAG